MRSSQHNLVQRGGSFGSRKQIRELFRVSGREQGVFEIGVHARERLLIAVKRVEQTDGYVGRVRVLDFERTDRERELIGNRPVDVRQVDRDFGRKHVHLRENGGRRHVLFGRLDVGQTAEERTRGNASRNVANRIDGYGLSDHMGIDSHFDLVQDLVDHEHHRVVFLQSQLDVGV